MINVGRLSMVSHLQMLHTTCIWPAIQRTRDPNIEGAGGTRNVKARVAVFKILWKLVL